MSYECNCKYCTDQREARKVKLEKNASEAYEEFAKEVIATEEKDNSGLKNLFDYLFPKNKVAETPKVEPVKAKAVIKDFVYAQTKQYFTETDTTTGEVKSDCFRIPERKQKVIHSDNTTVVILDDGTKGIAKCHPLDEQSRLTGIKIAYTRAKIKLLQKELKKLTK